jgi:hypothetical protein
MDTKTLCKRGASGVCLGVGCTLTLAKWGLNASEVVLNGAMNLANSFVNAPKLGIGSSLFGEFKKQTGKLADTFLKKGKQLAR